MEAKRTFMRYLDFILLFISICSLIGSGFLFANGFKTSQSEFEIARRCQAKFEDRFLAMAEQTKEGSSGTRKKFRIAEIKTEYFEAVDACVAENTDYFVEGLLWGFAFLLVIVGIFGVCYTGHRFKHEFKHVGDPTVGKRVEN